MRVTIEIEYNSLQEELSIIKTRQENRSLDESFNLAAQVAELLDEAYAHARRALEANGNDR